MCGVDTKNSFIKKTRVFVFCVVLVFCASVNPYADEPFKTASPETKISSVPPEPPLKSTAELSFSSGMEPRIRFWIDIFSRYFSWESAIHNVDYPQLVYKVINTEGNPNLVAREKLKTLGYLVELARKYPLIEQKKLKREMLSKEALSLLEVFEKNNLTQEIPNAKVYGKIRAQTGIKDGLIDSLYRSGVYLKPMQRVFKEKGVPKEIVYLPFIESGFNKNAISRVGASGIWQFMPYTGKTFLRVDDVVDERNDPMRAAYAAADLLTKNFEVLGSWPLAITAYNHGTAGIARAVKQVGSNDIEKIIDKFVSRSFGFASKNYYASFLAAHHVVTNAEFYLGSVPRARVIEFDEFVMPDYMSFDVFVDRMKLNRDQFQDLNPALTRAVFAGKKLIPVGYIVRVPVEEREDFLNRYERIPTQYKFTYQKTEIEEIDFTAQKTKLFPGASSTDEDRLLNPGGRAPASSSPEKPAE